MHAYINTYKHTNMPTYLTTYLPAYCHSYIHTYRHKARAAGAAAASPISPRTGIAYIHWHRQYTGLVGTFHGYVTYIRTGKHYDAYVMHV